METTVLNNSSSSRENGIRKYLTDSDLVAMLPQKCNLLYNRFTLANAIRKILGTLLPVDCEVMISDKLSTWIDDAIGPNDQMYTKAYKYDLIHTLKEFFVHYTYEYNIDRKYWERLLKDLRDKDVFKNWSYVKPDEVISKWRKQFFTLLPSEKYKVRGTIQELEVYDHCFDVFYPVLKALQDQISEVKISSTRPVDPPVLPRPGTTAFALAFGDVDSGLQELDDEATIEIRGETGISADVDIVDGKGDLVAGVTVVKPKALKSKEPKTKVPARVSSVASTPATVSFTIEMKDTEKPDYIIFYKFIPLWVIATLIVCYFVSFKVVEALGLLVPTDFLYDVEYLLTPMSVVRGRLWNENWWYTNWQVWPSEWIAYLLVNPVLYIAQSLPNIYLLLFNWMICPFTSWQAEYLNWTYSERDILVIIYGENSVIRAEAKLTNIILAGWVQMVAFVLRWLGHLGWLGALWLVVFGNRYLSVSDYLNIKRLDSLRLTPSFFMWTPYLTMDVSTGVRKTVHVVEDLRPSAQKIGDLAQLDYDTQVVHITTSNQILGKWEGLWGRYTGWHRNWAFGPVSTQRSHKMKILPELLSDVLDIKALNALTMADFQARIKQIMAATTNYNFDKRAMQNLENLAMNTFMYAVMLKKHDENVRLGNFPAGLWMIAPAQSTP